MKEELEDHMKLLLGHQETMKDIEKVRGQGCRAIHSTDSSCWKTGRGTAPFNHKPWEAHCRTNLDCSGRKFDIC